MRSHLVRRDDCPGCGERESDAAPSANPTRPAEAPRCRARSAADPAPERDACNRRPTGAMALEDVADRAGGRPVDVRPQGLQSLAQRNRSPEGKLSSLRQDPSHDGAWRCRRMALGAPRLLADPSHTFRARASLRGSSEGPTSAMYRVWIAARAHVTTPFDSKTVEALRVLRRSPRSGSSKNQKNLRNGACARGSGAVRPCGRAHMAAIGPVAAVHQVHSAARAFSRTRARATRRSVASLGARGLSEPCI
jgi:hypothetical protein